MIVNCSWNRTSHEFCRVHSPKMDLTHVNGFYNEVFFPISLCLVYLLPCVIYGGV